MKYVPLRSLLFILYVVSIVHAGTTGKIAGTIWDAETGEALPGVNIVIEGTTLGAVSNIDGYYVILNVSPGTHVLKASMVGFSRFRVENLRVQIDLTTTQDIRMTQEVLEGETVTVVAQRPVLMQDVSSSQANLSIEEVAALPAVDVTTIVGLEAGIQGMSIRGGGSDEVAFVVNGITLRDERDNTPYTGISFTSVDEIQILTGGFNAEFGNIRSGIINVVTKEGKKEAYTFGMISRYSPPAQKHFGISPHNLDAFWIKPYIDDNVCWTGTQSGAWDEWTQTQYQNFEGWNAISEKTLKDKDPNNDLTPHAAQRLFLWEHRRQLDIDRPDYDFDVSFGGPVPMIGKKLGGLRFFASYRLAEDMYLVPLSRDSYKDYNLQLKVTSDITPSMKLMIEAIQGRATGTNTSNSGLPGIFRSSWSIADVMNRVSYIDTRMFTTDYWAPTAVFRQSMAAKLTNVVSSKTFYEVSLQRFESKYDTNPGRARDTSKVYLFGNNYYVDEAPFGFQPDPSWGIAGGDGGSMRMGVGMSNSRDSSRVIVYTGRFDFVHQVDRYNNIKAGLEFTYTDNNVNYARVEEFLIQSNSFSQWHTFPKRGAVYIQDKMEFEGMIANIGVRLDYSHAGGEWYDFDLYTDAFASESSAGIDTLLDKKSTKHIFNLSPRLGVSFPITANSKLYFNYGHFRQLPTPDNLYLFRKDDFTKAVNRIGDPNIELPKTVAYELGYEHNLFDQFLLRAAGYYRDVSFQPRAVQYRSRDNKVSYITTQPDNYEDIRGFEFTLRKNRGAWVQGFINYTYMVNTSGNFGFGEYNENPATQRQYEREYRANYQTKPVPRPYARANIYFFTPKVFGPKMAGLYPLGELRFNLLARWSAGYHFTWTGGGTIPGIVNNVQYRDSYGADMRLSKTFKVAGADIELFMDINNLFNIKYMSTNGFYDGRDYIAYMQSLHLPEKIGKDLQYEMVYGDDRPGDYRKPGVKFVPIEIVKTVDNVRTPHTRPLYYEKDNKRYMVWDGQEFKHADQGVVDRVLEDKAYIDMPNQEYFTFLDPHDIFFGVKINFQIR